MVQVSRLIAAVYDTRQQNGAAAFSALKPGDCLRARVLRIESDQRILLDFGHFRALAQMDREIATGDLLHLKVTDTGPPVQMQIWAQDEPDSSWETPRLRLGLVLTPADRDRLNVILGRIMVSKAMAEDRPDIDSLQRAMSGVRDLTAPLSLEHSPGEIATRLQTILEKQGLFFEKKLAQWLLTQTSDALAHKPVIFQDPAVRDEPVISPAPLPTGARLLDGMLTSGDVKSHLLILQSFVARLAPAEFKHFGLTAKQMAFLEGAVTKLLAHIQEEQEHLVQKHSHSQLYENITHWLPVTGQKQPLKLKWYYPKNRDTGDGDVPHQVCLLLDMDRLGPVRADLKLSGGRLDVNFSVISGHVLLAFEGALEQLTALLETFFLSVDGRVVVAPARIDGFERPEIIETADGRIDIQA